MPAPAAHPRELRVPTEGDHRHCKVCGRLVKPGADTCSDTCATERQRRISSARNYRYLMYGTIALLLILFLSSFRL
jgi:predicted nucleic acid-binding Zn ribbon protein